MNNPIESREQIHKLLVSGWVNLSALNDSPVEIVRGMPIVSLDGQEVGKVAAVVVDTATQKAACILLCRLPQAPDYRLVPLDLLAQVTCDVVILSLQSRDVDGLAVHKPA